MRLRASAATALAASAAFFGFAPVNGPWELAAQEDLPLLWAPFAPVVSRPSFHLLPVSSLLGFRSSWTDDRENGALWAGKGLSALARGGVAWRSGLLHVVLAPEVAWASNGAFPLADSVSRGVSPHSAPWIAVDLPRRWGDGMAMQVLPGQSTVELRWPGLAFGVTSANLVRGPEMRYPLLLGASAPGVPSAFIEAASRPLGAFGSLSFRLQSGLLRESPHFDENSENDRTLFTAYFLDWEPGFASGLVLGASVTYRDPLEGGFTPSMLLRAFTFVGGQELEHYTEDGMAAFHARWSVAPLTAWGTWGRGDYWLDTEDLLTELDHNQVFVLGAMVDWTVERCRWEVAGEAASMVGTLGRGAGVLPYRHGRAIQGYTNRGQMLGASVGPGSKGAWLRVQRTDSAHVLGIEIERIDRDLDAYNHNFVRRDGPGLDREWRLAALYEGPAPGFRGAAVGLQASGGVSLRWNRDYIRYSRNADRVGPRETQLFLDLALTWDPNGR